MHIITCRYYQCVDNPLDYALCDFKKYWWKRFCLNEFKKNHTSMTGVHATVECAGMAHITKYSHNSKSIASSEKLCIPLESSKNV